MNNIIEIIEEQLQKQKDEIFFKDMLIKDLRASLEKAQKEIEELKGAKE